MVHVLANPRLEDVGDAVVRAERLAGSRVLRKLYHSPSSDRPKLASLPLLHLLHCQTLRRLDQESLDEEVEEVMRGAEGAVGHEERREVVAVDCEQERKVSKLQRSKRERETNLGLRGSQRQRLVREAFHP